MLLRNWIELIALVLVLLVGGLVLYLVRRSAADYESEFEVRKKQEVKGKS